MPTKVAEIEDAAVTSGWDSDWDMLYPAGSAVATSAPAPGATTPLGDLESQIVMLQRMKQLRDLQAIIPSCS
jgi:hypothetical protein